ncbi:hypothetical protein SLEP1_g12838 [Rubroshorea leprosula]|uniref:PHD finger protein ALFIN-LIKE n=1 Tax=Rubroshorea leprosula TaxID=152421 RepID=A0AAV5IML2_9ROSI|nr:hypothetical protein SLEP1_g12838 [Rubroshorea leprosula]
MDGGAAYNPRTVEEVFKDFKGRRAGLIKALTIDVEEFYQQCDPGNTFSPFGKLNSLISYLFLFGC